ncbi:MAG: ABC transporter ATP-binding protein [Sphaerochaeta sp.]|nr:ABC transporter ATP-binding protein [Sphaerochaeta sp.]
MSRIVIKDVMKAFGDVVVLNNFNAEFADGEFVTLLGPSGCGKTTMLRMIAGFEKPTRGEIFIGDQEVSSTKTFIPPEKRDIGMVFQSYAIWPHMTVFENVAYPLKMKKMDKESIREQVAKVLEIVHLSQYTERMPSQLSGGQQQRVALARALVAQPQLLLLDEPLSNLDAKLRDSMRFEIKEIQQSLGITVVYVTHDQMEAMTMSDRVIVINHGDIQQIGKPTEIYRHPANQFVADFVGKINFIRATSANGEVRFKDSEQKLPYEGELQGDVIVGIRPENLRFIKTNGDLSGTLVSQFYLGDVNDCRVDLGGEQVRVIAEPKSFDKHTEGENILLRVDEFSVFVDTGDDEFMKILT